MAYGTFIIAIGFWDYLQSARKKNVGICSGPFIINVVALRVCFRLRLLAW